MLLTTPCRGGGVDGAVHRGAGPELLSYSIGLGGCQTGEAKRSPGFELPVKHIIHTVGPVWQGGDKGEAELLRSCNTNSFQLALQFGVKRIAFPCISTGVCGFPKENAPTIALTAMRQYEPSLERIVAYCYAEADAELYRRLHHA